MGKVVFSQFRSGCDLRACALKPEAFQECFTEWISRLPEGKDDNDQRHIAIAGKTLRGSSDSNKEIGLLHLVSAC
jgi:hypothetical protein